jgi:hypothetical protein
MKRLFSRLLTSLAFLISLQSVQSVQADVALSTNDIAIGFVFFEASILTGNSQDSVYERGPRAVGDSIRLFQKSGYIFEDLGLVPRFNTILIQYEVRDNGGGGTYTYFHNNLGISEGEINATLEQYSPVLGMALIKLADWRALVAADQMPARFSIANTEYWLAGIPYVQVLQNGQAVPIHQPVQPTSL